MGPPQRQQPDQARPAGSACVSVVAVVLLLAVLAGGGCLVLYVTLPPAEAPHWLPAAGLALAAFPWAFWIATRAYRCCCSGSDAASPPVASNVEERQASSRKATVAPTMPSSKSLKGARSVRHAADGATPAVVPHRQQRRAPGAVRRHHRAREGAAAAAAEGDKDDDSSVHSNESEAAPLAYNMEPSS